MPLIMSKFDSYYQNIKKKRKAVELKEQLVREEQLMREVTRETRKIVNTYRHLITPSPIRENGHRKRA